MSPSEWTAVIGCVIAVIAAVYSAARFMIRAILAEFVPNGGSSLKDQVNRIEARLDILIDKLL